MMWAYGALLVVGAALLISWKGNKPDAHAWAAFAMFFCVWVVVSINGWRREELATSYQRSYRILLALMVASAAVILGYKVADEWDKFHERTGWGGPPNWHQSTFWLEVIEIVLFAAFWGIQTRQRWFDEQHGGEPTS